MFCKNCEMYICLFLVFFLSSCVNQLADYNNNLSSLLNATDKDYGKKPTVHRELIETSIKATLVDPDSVIFRGNTEPYQCDFPSKQDLSIPMLGWCSDISYNAKNGFGGYVGFKTQKTLYINGRVYSICKPLYSKYISGYACSGYNRLIPLSFLPYQDVAAVVVVEDD